MLVISFIGGVNRSTRRKPLTCRKSLTTFIKSQCCIKNTFIYIIYHVIVYQPPPSISSNTYIIYYADIHMHTICIKDSLQKATSGTLFKIKFCCLYSGFPLLQFEQINLFQSYSLCRLGGWKLC
jgi:hypothetical protein